MVLAGKGKKMNMRLALTGCLVAGLGATANTPAAVPESFFMTPAAICQLSDPTTTSSGVKPRATSYDNSGTTNVFVICGMVNPGARELQMVDMGLRSLDGIAHSVTCTAVNGFYGLHTPIYSSKTANVPATGPGISTAWFGVDFGSLETIPNSTLMSVTCNLPPNVGIAWTQVTN